MKITEYPQIGKLDKQNIFLIDGPNGTKIINGENFPFAVMNLTAAEMHRMIFRGKNIGASLSTEQKAHIQDGSFEDLWLGDYWAINGINWRIVDVDYWYNTGTTAFTKHHLVVMPDTALYSAQMNTTAITTGGYVGSLMYTSNLTNAKTIVNSAFGGAVLTHRELLVNAVSNGYSSAGAWYDSSVELPNEPMMYGSYINTPAGDGTIIPYRNTIDKSQLALFQVCPRFIVDRSSNQWLRDVVSADSFAVVHSNSVADIGASSANYASVRPVFAIG